MLLRERMNNRLFLVDLLAILFGISSWISINGLWVELPMLVNKLPEYWSLPSYLSIIVQIANIGPIIYGLLRNCLRTPPPQHISVITLLSIGCLASLALVLTWDLTSTFNFINDDGEDDSLSMSTGLFLSVFFLALVDCTSSVLFLPYMGIFKQKYLNSYLIGEGMSGFIPSLAALAQGVSGNPECSNGTIIHVEDQARFSTTGFFIFLMVMMSLSLIAFILLHYLPYTKSERVGTSPSSSANFSDALEVAHQDERANDSDDSSDQSVHSDDSNESNDHRDDKQLNIQPQNSRFDIYQLLMIQCLVCCLSNGALPSIQSYSCLPYGNTVYHLAVTLNAMANPMMAFLAFFLPCSRKSVVYILTALSCGLAGFIIATALNSPEMIGSLSVGGSMVVLTWVATGAMFSYVKVCVAGMCRNSGYLFSCGVVTQVGSAVGALVMFILVNVVNLFKSVEIHC